MTWMRWVFFLILAWAVIGAWSEDPEAMQPTSPRFSVYLTCLAVVSVAAIAFEVVDWLKASKKNR